MASDNSKELKQNEKIVAEFQSLRNEQRNLVNNLNTLEMDLKEHKYEIFQPQIFTLASDQEGH